MRPAEVNLTALYVVLLSISGMIIPYVEPQLAGLWGGGMYLVVRHESNTGTFSIGSLLIVLLMGYTGAWAVTHAIPLVYADLHNVFIQILSFSAGFMMYDFYMAWGNNTKSVIGVLAKAAKTILEKVVEKWNA